MTAHASAASDHQREIVFLLSGAELIRSLLNVFQYAGGFKVLIFPERFQEPRFAEFLSAVAGSVGDPIGVDTQDISGS